MYWPIGVPSVYTAACGPRNVTDHAAEAVSTNNYAHALTDNGTSRSQDILDISASRSGEVFATITDRSISIWQTKPMVVLASVIRSSSAIEQHGTHLSVHMQPDASLVTVRTTRDKLVIYSLSYIVDSCVYQTKLRSAVSRSRRSLLPPELEYGPGDGQGIRKVAIDHRATLHIQSEIATVVSLDGEILIATTGADRTILRIETTGDHELTAELLANCADLSWLEDTAFIQSIVYSRPMRLHIWLTSDGRAYAVQRHSNSWSGADNDNDNDGTKAAPSASINGFCFHNPASQQQSAVCAMVNARFSLVAIGCADAIVRVYHAKDYLGNVPFSHKLELGIAPTKSGKLQCLQSSPDGYCIFAGFEKGWAMWSVYGSPGANSFDASRDMAVKDNQQWLMSCRNAFWTFGGSGLVFTGRPSHCVNSIDIARSSTTACFNMANVSRMTLQTGTSILLHRGLGEAETTNSAMSGTSQWQTVQLPAAFLARQWPVRCSVVSPDGNYLAAAGRRGIAHYSVSSGRWRTFDDFDQEDDFVVRGGMCWYQHVLVAAVDAGGSFEIRLYSRERKLDTGTTLHTEYLDYAVIHMAVTGDDSLLVYTHENMLLHYVFVIEQESVRIEQVGKIGLHGIIRAPSRVRSINWIIPDEQRQNGLPSQDVATASVLFLVDAKLVLLRPCVDEQGALKYDMRVVAHNVEYYLLTRETLVAEQKFGLSDSLMVYNGQNMLVWPDMGRLLALNTTQGEDMAQHEVTRAVVMRPDFYPLSADVEIGALSGIEPEVVQRHDVSFAHCRLKLRRHLAIPGLVEYFLTNYDSASALHMCESYQDLPYFAHGLEMLLHDLVERTVDARPSQGQGVNGDDSSEGESRETQWLLANVLAFLSSFPCYLDVIVGCTRKTEIRMWSALFKHLPPVPRLFEEALAKGSLKTAGGLLLILHTFNEEEFNSEVIGKLLHAASSADDWDLCKEVSRFLVGIDDSGGLLKASLGVAGLGPSGDG